MVTTRVDSASPFNPILDVRGTPLDSSAPIPNINVESPAETLRTIFPDSYGLQSGDSKGLQAPNPPKPNTEQTKFLNSQYDQAYGIYLKHKDFLGPNPSLENLILAVFAEAYTTGGRDLLQQIQGFSSTLSSTSSLKTNTASLFGQGVGATLGGYFGGPTASAFMSNVGASAAKLFAGDKSDMPHSRTLELEKIKAKYQELQQTIQALSAISSMNHQMAMAIIRNFKG